MVKRLGVVLVLAFACIASGAEPPKLPAPKAPAVPEADGYVVIPDASVPPSRSHVYKAIFDSTQGSDDPKAILPALNMLGSELNAMAVAGVPSKNVKFVVSFHGPAVQGLLKDDAYRKKFGVSNPNIPVLKTLRSLGVELYVCGQFLAFEHVDTATLSPDVAIASDALIVLMTYQNQGYALLSF